MFGAKACGKKKLTSFSCHVLSLRGAIGEWLLVACRVAELAELACSSTQPTGVDAQPRRLQKLYGIYRGEMLRARPKAEGQEVIDLGQLVRR